MFWGLIMEPNKRYTQEVEKSFHVSQASLDVSTSDGEPVQVMVTYEKKNYLIGTLQKNKVMQIPLDLNFETGNKISFTSNGNSHVHLTGYLVPDDPYSDLGDEDASDEDMEDAVEQEDSSDAEVPQLVPATKKEKRKSDSTSPAAATAAKKAKKSVKTIELADLLNNTKDDDTSEDDDDFDPDNVTIEGNDSDELEFDSDGILDELAEDDDDDEDDEDDNEAEQNDSDDSDEQEEEEQKPVAKKPKQKSKQSPTSETNNAKAAATKQGKQQTSTQQNGVGPGKKDKKPNTETKQGNKKTLSGGVVVEDMKLGQGQQAASGKRVQVYYIGRLQSNNKIFDSSQKGPGFKFALGKGEVIKGWEVGLAGMKVGGKRKITIPPQMAYGAKGSPPVIPPNSTLVFEVELRNVH